MHAKEREVEMERKAAMKYMQDRWGLAREDSGQGRSRHWHANTREQGETVTTSIVKDCLMLHEMLLLTCSSLGYFQCSLVSQAFLDNLVS
jgi:hypothetical protein